MRGEAIEGVFDLRLARSRDGFTKPALLAVVVVLGFVLKAAPVSALGHDRPAGQAASELSDILLSVATVDAKRVQLHHLASVVLVRVCGIADVVVEIDEHRGRVGRGPEQVAEPTKGMRSNDVALIDQFEHMTVLLLDADIEVIGPEFDDALIKLSTAEHLAQQGGTPQLGRDEIQIDIIEKAIAHIAQGVRIERPHRQPRELEIGSRVIEAHGRELLLDPSRYPDLGCMSQLFGPWAIREPVEHSEDLGIDWR
ncbi:MAG TPA: hypothetical protein PK954_14800 [Anaerolineales bacterium]|nr:hypothetical protein [Anaerolineales bacterium]